MIGKANEKLNGLLGADREWMGVTDAFDNSVKTFGQKVDLMNAASGQIQIYSVNPFGKWVSSIRPS